MPHDNQFRHQTYPTTPANTPVLKKLTTDYGKGVDFSRLHTQFGVSKVIVVHGTFMGDDPFAIAEILRSIGSGVPVLASGVNRLADMIVEKTQPTTQTLTKDVGNYDQSFCDRFQELVGDDPSVRLMQPTWTGQNHHLARADLAVRLFCNLAMMNPAEAETILLWGHSHAGNGFALLSNLLANHRESVEDFFVAAGDQPGEHWAIAKGILRDAPSPHPLAKHILVAAFGTPVRYGWDSSGYKGLLHILHHRNYDEEKPLLTRPLFPPHKPTDVLSAKFGDWVQAFAIAGTDVAPPTSIANNKELGSFLEASLPEPAHGLDTKLIVPKRVRDACYHWKTGTRCHSDGLNLLLEYAPCGRQFVAGQPVEESILGHGVATTIDWLPAHLALTLRWLETVA